MHRILAILLVPALLCATSAAAWPHVHEYIGHDHPEHHHGPAVHGHSTTPTDHAPQNDLGSRFGRKSNCGTQAPAVETCDAGSHAVTLAFVGVNPDNPPVAASTVATETADRPIDSRPALVPRPADIRVHGPPGVDPGSPRPPPASFPRQVS